MTKKGKIELLSPAGDLERLKTAVAFGADAVYCGLPDWSLRNPREIKFDLDTLKEGIEFAHKKGVKVFVTLNVFPHESMLDKMESDIKKLKKLDIDGVILSDLGTLSLVKKHLPKAEIHVSTQANTLNSEAIKVWTDLGAKRIVLAREVTLSEIKEIKKKINSPFFAKASKGNFNHKIEIEVFGHGAMCMAYSGRCLLSKYYTGREANLGDCAQSCRWKYRVKKTKKQENNQTRCQIQDNNETIQQFGNDYFLEEETRPGDLLEVQEDENGTYFMNSKEICALGIIDKFIESGIDSLKIEGRAKTVYYLATVTRAYRKAIDLYYAGKLTKKSINDLYSELNLIQNRGYSHGFLLGRHGYEQEYEIAAYKPPVMFLGVVLDSGEPQPNTATQFDGVKIQVKNKFKVGEDIEIVTPDEIIKAKILEIRDEKDNILEEILKPQEKVWLKLNTKKSIPERSILRKRK